MRYKLKTKREQTRRAKPVRLLFLYLTFTYVEAAEGSFKQYWVIYTISSLRIRTKLPFIQEIVKCKA